MDTAILGAGAAGLTLGMRLALAGDRVTIVEREPLPGGLAAGFPVGDVMLEKFYHHLFRTDRAIIELLREIGLGEDLIWSAPNTSVLVDNWPYQLNSALSVLRFAPISFLDRLRMGAAIGYLKYWPNYHSLEGKTAEDWLRRWMGRAAYERVWQPQLAGNSAHSRHRWRCPGSGRGFTIARRNWATCAAASSAFTRGWRR